MPGGGKEVLNQTSATLDGRFYKPVNLAMLLCLREARLLPLNSSIDCPAHQAATEL